MHVLGRSRGSSLLDYGLTQPLWTLYKLHMSEEQEIHRRPVHEEGTGRDGEEGEGTGKKGPRYVRKRDLDDASDGNVKESDREVKGSPAARRRVSTRRSSTEVAMAFFCHMSLTCFYIYVFWYDATILKETKEKDLWELVHSYGGRLKYITDLNLRAHLVYFSLSFFTDLLPQGGVKIRLQSFCDWMFVTVAFPGAMFVGITFWGIYAIDRELIYPASRDEYIPALLNHFWHTTIVIAVIMELLLVFHRYPTNRTAIAVVSTYNAAYLVWILWILAKTGKWVYPFLSLMSPLFVVVFVAACFFLYIAFYFLGKWTGYLWWRGHHELTQM